MASENWIKSLEAILHHEGGYVNHPKDPGGETNLGVTKRVYEDFGGNSREVQHFLQGDVQHIYSSDYAFAALKLDGTVVIWGGAAEPRIFDGHSLRRP